MPEYGAITETLLENTLMNILNEALAGEYNLTARRRFIATCNRSNLTTSTPKKK